MWEIALQHIFVDEIVIKNKKVGQKIYPKAIDEINLASAIGLIPVSDVVSLVKSAKCHVVLTGRRALKELVDVADFVTEYTDLKRKDKKAEAGIEF